MLNTDKIKLVDLRRELYKRETLLRRAFKAFGYDHGDDLELWRKEQAKVLSDINTLLDSLK